MDYLTWTYLYRRLQMNPTYYGLDDPSPQSVAMYLSELVEATVQDLADSYCVEQLGELELVATTLGKIASYYYLDHRTIRMFKDRITPDYRAKGDAAAGHASSGDFHRILRILADAIEYSELPVRHNEDLMNMDMEKLLPFPAVDNSDSAFGGGRAVFAKDHGYDDPNTKTFLLFEGHLSRLRSLPCADYYTDTKSVLDQAIRILQAMVDVAADQGYLSTALGIMRAMQSIKQARWPTEPDLLTLPHFHPDLLPTLANKGRRIETLAELAKLPDNLILPILEKLPGLSKREVQSIASVIYNLPVLDIRKKVVAVKSKEGGSAEIPFLKGKDERIEAVRLEAGMTYELKVEAKRLRPHRGKVGGKNKGRARRKGLTPLSFPPQDFNIHAPHYPKPQHEGWWLMLVDREADDILALTRVSPVNAAVTNGRKTVAPSAPLTSTLRFVAPQERGRFEYSILMVSDGYLGLDVEDEFAIEVR